MKNIAYNYRMSGKGSTHQQINGLRNADREVWFVSNCGHDILRNFGVNNHHVKIVNVDDLDCYITVYNKEGKQIPPMVVDHDVIQEILWEFLGIVDHTWR